MIKRFGESSGDYCNLRGFGKGETKPSGFSINHGHQSLSPIAKQIIIKKKKKRTILCYEGDLSAMMERDLTFNKKYENLVFYGN